MTTTLAPLPSTRSRGVYEHLVVEADLVLREPAHFGGGDGTDLTDMPLLVDTAGDTPRPLLTGASLAGALRQALRDRTLGYRAPAPTGTFAPTAAAERAGDTARLFGGFSGDDLGAQSPLVVHDAFGTPTNPPLELRTAVRLDAHSETALEGYLYTWPCWAAGTTFRIRLELDIARQRAPGSYDWLPPAEQDAYRTRLLRTFLSALDELEQQHVALGSRKQRGYGLVQPQHWRLRHFRHEDPDDLCAWVLHGKAPLHDPTPLDGVRALADVGAFQDYLGIDELLPDRRHHLDLSMKLHLEGSLLIRAAPDPLQPGPDVVHQHARLPDEPGGGSGHFAPVVPGTSTAGALRQRARTILNTLRVHYGRPRPQRSALLDHLFGTDMHGRDEEQPTGSHLIIRQGLVHDAVTDLVQHRIALDRLTGGVHTDAFFTEQPAFAKPETRVSLDLRLVNPTPETVGLVLLLAKDLQTSDLPLGGEAAVGRGRLHGEELSLVEQTRAIPPDPAPHQEHWSLTEDKDGDTHTRTGNWQTLQDHVAALHTYLRAEAPSDHD